MTAAAISQVRDSSTRPVFITVNNKPVKIEGPRASGLQIKEAAIMQGVAIKLDFQLAVLGSDGKYYPVGDAELVEVSNDSTFVATAGDDNS